LSRRIRIFDTTLRDGEQTPGVNLSSDEKLEIAHQLARLGVDVIEAGFPITSRGDFEAVRRIAERVKGPTICGLARTNPEDIDRAWEAVEPAERSRIHIFVATSAIHMKHKLRKEPHEVIKMAVEAVERSRIYTEDVEFSAEDATRSEPAFLAEVFAQVIRAGATTINIPDTVGYTTPGEFRRLIGYLKENVPGIENVTLSVHCHDDLGLAVANSLAAVECGVDQVECTINGLGERAGNAALEEIVMALRTRRDHYVVEVSTSTEQISRTSRLVSGLTGIKVQPNKAIVGANAFAHQSGVHQDGVLKERTTYEIMTPQSVGLATNRIVLGKVSGSHAFRQKLEELGYNVSEDEARRIFAKFKVMADRKKDISDRDIEAIVENEIHSVPEVFRLGYFHISSGNQTIPTATVKVYCGNEEKQEAASGDGPVDALFKAIDRATGSGVRLVDYSLKAVTSGKDALGEASLKVDSGGRLFTGRGVSVDVLEASAKAYVNALNRVEHDRNQDGRNLVGQGPS